MKVEQIIVSTLVGALFFLLLIVGAQRSSKRWNASPTVLRFSRVLILIAFIAFLLAEFASYYIGTTAILIILLIIIVLSIISVTIVYFYSSRLK